MLDALKRESNLTETLNGDVAYRSTTNCLLDFFSKAGALRGRDKETIQKWFSHAYYENPDYAMKCLFFSRDIRQGLGERNLFRDCLEWLGKNKKESLIRNLKYIPEYGRWDDAVYILSVVRDKSVRDSVYELLKKQFDEDLTAVAKSYANISLLGKWLPSINTSSFEARRLAKGIIRRFGITAKDYRKSLSALRSKISIIENNLRVRDYSFDYSKIPSKAMMKYRRCFFRNDEERYTSYLDEVESGKKKINVSTLNPVDIVRQCKEVAWNDPTQLTDNERKMLDVAWKSLPDYTNGEDAIVVADVSGSMHRTGNNNNVRPIDVSISLALYYAEHNTGAFKDHFIIFSHNPSLVSISKVKSEDIFAKVEYVRSFDEWTNTDLDAVFELILRTAIKNKIPQDKLPKRIYIISDMQFDRGMDNAGLDTFNRYRKLFGDQGYSLPQIVYWNVNDYGTTPVTSNEQGCCLVSGYSSRMFGMVTSEDINPINVMMDILDSDRYKDITA